MLANKDIVNAYKRPKAVKRTPSSSTWFDRFMLSYGTPMFLILIGVASILPTLALGLYFKQSALQIAIRTIIAFISYCGTSLLVATPFMGAGASSNPYASNSHDSAFLVASIAGFIPQIIYVLCMLK